MESRRRRSREPGESEKGVAASVSPITVANPAMPPEALQAPISEEEASYRKELHERLAKLSDEVPESEKKKRPEKYRKGLSGALQNGGRFRDKSLSLIHI